MSFDTILDSWENRRDEVEKAGADVMSENWLDDYLPDARALKNKDEGNSVHQRGPRVNWRREAHQNVLDLHGMTEKEARKEIGFFIDSMRRRGLRKGLIIHGKGLHSGGRAILGSVVRDCLESSSEVGEFRRAKAKNGGSGATWFLLRQRSR